MALAIIIDEYVKKINKGELEIDDVPKDIRDIVKNVIEQDKNV